MVNRCVLFGEIFCNFLKWLFTFIVLSATCLSPNSSSLLTLAVQSLLLLWFQILSITFLNYLFLYLFLVHRLFAELELTNFHCNECPSIFPMFSWCLILWTELNKWYPCFQGTENRWAFEGTECSKESIFSDYLPYISSN